MVLDKMQGPYHGVLFEGNPPRFTTFSLHAPMRNFKNKFVRTTMRLFNAIFFSIFVLFHGWFVSMKLYHWLQIDFTWFCNRFCHFYNVATDIWMDGWIDRWTEWWTDRQNNGRTDQWMDGHAMYVHRHAKIHDFSIYFAIFTKASP